MLAVAIAFLVDGLVRRLRLQILIAVAFAAYARWGLILLARLGQNLGDPRVPHVLAIAIPAYLLVMAQYLPWASWWNRWKLRGGRA